MPDQGWLIVAPLWLWENKLGNSVEQHWMKSEQKLAFFSGSALYDSMTVRENLEFPLRRHTKNLSLKDTTPLVMQALENGLAHAVNLTAELSGGMKRRIA
jgi:ABC-type transporter Mla maintaining outer membrane lipid asymmetry ATPase subunit MlaF